MRSGLLLGAMVTIEALAACSTFGDEDVTTPPIGDDAGPAAPDAGPTTDAGVAPDGAAVLDGGGGDGGAAPACEGAPLLANDFESLSTNGWETNGSNGLTLDSAFKTTNASSLRAGPFNKGTGRLTASKGLTGVMAKRFCLSLDLATAQSIPASPAGYVEVLQVDVFPTPLNGSGAPRIYLGVGFDGRGLFVHVTGNSQDVNEEIELGAAQTFHRWTFVVDPGHVTVWVDGRTVQVTPFGQPTVGSVDISVGFFASGANPPTVTSWSDNLKASLLD